MMFEQTHGLAVDGSVGAQVWHALLADAVAGTRRTDGYSYVYVHRNVPQLLTLWHNGKTVLTSPGNTGVPAAPTQLGTYPVFEHIPIGTMSGTNPTAPTTTTPGSAGSATSTAATRCTPSPERPSARRRASAASSSRSRPQPRSGPTPRSARSSRSKTDRAVATRRAASQTLLASARVRPGSRVPLEVRRVLRRSAPTA